MSKRLSWLFCALMVVLLTACAPLAGRPTGGDTTVRAWFDEPLPETVYYPPNPCDIVAHGASPSGIARFELTINNVATILPSPDNQGSLATLTHNCGLTQPGRYLLRMRALDHAGSWSGYAETSLIIGGGATSTPGAPPPQPLVIASPTTTSPPAVAGGVSIESISTYLVYAGEDNCGPSNVTIVARATAPKGIQVVVLFYRFEPGSPSGFQNTAMSPIGGDLFQASLNPTAALGSAADATLQYQVVVQQSDGDTSIRTPVLADITVQACGSVAVDCPSFTGKRACESHGCSWVAAPAIVPVYECRNP